MVLLYGGFTKHLIDSLGFIAKPIRKFGRSVDAQIVHGVRVSPDSPDWFLEVVVQVSQRYALAATPQRSDLADDPII